MRQTPHKPDHPHSENLEQTLLEVNRTLKQHLNREALADALSENMQGITNLDELLPKIAEGMMQILEFQRGAWFSVDPDKATCFFMYGSEDKMDLFNDQEIALLEGGGFAQSGLEGRICVIDDAKNIPYTQSASNGRLVESDIVERFDTSAFVTIPFIKKVEKQCWIECNCPNTKCPAWGTKELRCWKIPHTFRCQEEALLGQPLSAAEKARNCPNCPVYNHREPFMILFLDQPENSPIIQDEQLQLIRLITSHASVMLENAQLYEGLAERTRTLQQHKEYMEKELRLARHIQKAILPISFPSEPELRFAAINIPAEAVGGDLYYHGKIAERVFGFGIADVSGKGVPAALFMSMAFTMLSDAARMHASPKDAMREVNQRLAKYQGSGRYLSAIHMVYDLDRSMIRFTKAGHEAPCMIRADGTVEMLDGDGFFLGIFENGQYEEKETPFEKGDRLYLFTDGAIDVCNSQGEPFGHQRLLELLVALQHIPVEEALAQVRLALEDHVKDEAWSDDVTLLALENPPDIIEQRAWQMKAAPGEISQTIELITRFVHHSGLTEGQLPYMLIAVREAINNAVEHGSKADPDRIVEIRAISFANAVSVTVADSGEGFDPHTLPNPLAPEHLMKPRGRGVFLMKKFVDRVHFTHKANLVTLTMRKS